jgi:predicted acetyltransferase
MGHPIQLRAPDPDQWQEFDQLATRSYGHGIGDITALREHAITRVAVRAGRVVAGGLGLLVPQFFGGRPVPSACLAAGYVAPEERGERLAELIVAERLRVLTQQGAVISTVWTKASAYARHLGWEAVVPVSAWSIATDELKGSFPATSPAVRDLDITHGLTERAQHLQTDLATCWNGPVQRPPWWWHWKQAKNNLTTYTFTASDGSPAGLVSLATARHPRHGTTLQVHDFWAAHTPAAEAMFAFLGRYATRAETIDFRRGVMPPYPFLLHNLHRYRVTTEAWHPWMIRILDIPQALRLRGWPTGLTTDVTIDLAHSAPTDIREDAVEDRGHHRPHRFTLSLSGGHADVEDTTRPADVVLTPGQLAAWYAGAYRSATSARLAGVLAATGDVLSTLVRATAHTEPWLPDHF